MVNELILKSAYIIIYKIHKRISRNYFLNFLLIFHANPRSVNKSIYLIFCYALNESKGGAERRKTIETEITVGYKNTKKACEKGFCRIKTIYWRQRWKYGKDYLTIFLLLILFEKMRKFFTIFIYKTIVIRVNCVSYWFEQIFSKDYFVIHQCIQKNCKNLT